MITAQDIRSKTFEKAVFGGYDMGTVDAFLEEIANDLTLLQKENAVLKGKMKVLVDKVEAYRGNEDALRMAVLSAQKLGGSIEKEARDRADAMLNEARQEAARIIEDAAAEHRAEELRLQETKRISAEFIESMNRLCQREREFLQRVGERDFVREQRAAPAAAAPVPAPAPEPAPTEKRTAAPGQENTEIHETVKSIEETVAKVMDEPVVNVRPGGMKPSMVEDERPTRSFSIVSDPDDAVDRSVQFSLDEFSK